MKKLIPVITAVLCMALLMTCCIGRSNDSEPVRESADPAGTDSPYDSEPDTDRESAREPEAEGYVFRSEDCFADPSELIWALQDRFGMNAMDDAKVYEICGEGLSTMFAVHHDTDDKYTVFARRYDMEEMFWGDMIAYEGVASEVREADGFGSGGKELYVTMQGGLRRSVNQNSIRSATESPTLHYPPEQEIVRPWTMILDGEGRIREIHGMQDDTLFFVDDCSFDYEGYRIVGIRYPGGEVTMRYERENDSLCLMNMENGEERRLYTLHYDEKGRKTILYDEEGEKELLNYSSAVIDAYGKTEKVRLGSFGDEEDAEITFLYNKIGPIMTFDGVWTYSDQGYADRSDTSFYTYDYGDSELTVSLYTLEGERVGYRVYSLQGKLLAAYYLSASTGQMTPYSLDDTPAWGDWIFPENAG